MDSIAQHDGVEQYGAGDVRVGSPTPPATTISVSASISVPTSARAATISTSAIEVTGENGAIRIGTSGSQTETFIAGIWGSPVTGSAVYISSSGQLGVLASSERYKTDIQSMGSGSARLDQLRPVTFRLKNEPHGAIRYGLIAEEVAQVYPELVIRARDGRIEGVRYEELAPMLLNEVQQQRQALVAQEEHLAAQELRLADQATRQLQSLERRLADDVIFEDGRICSGMFWRTARQALCLLLSEHQAPRSRRSCRRRKADQWSTGSKPQLRSGRWHRPFSPRMTGSCSYERPVPAAGHVSCGSIVPRTRPLTAHSPICPVYLLDPTLVTRKLPQGVQ